MNLRLARVGRGVTATLNKMFGGTRSPTEDGIQLDTDMDGIPQYKEDIIAKIRGELEKRKSERKTLEKQWTLNANFLVGNQYCDINPYTNEIEQIEPAYDWMERTAFNQIAPLVETRIANLKKINYMMKVNPRTSEFDDYTKAEVSTAILQHTQKVSDFETKKNTAIWWNEVCGSCFFLTWWDPNKGNLYAEEHTATVNADTGEAEVETKAYYEGDIDYGLLTPYEVYPESMFKQTVEAQKSIIIEQVRSVDEVYDIYGIRVNGTSVDTFALTPVGSAGGLGYENCVLTLGHRTMDDAATVVTYFEKPTRHTPHGKMAIVINDEHLVYYGNLPYSRIPITQMICREVPGQFFGKSAIEDLIPRQRAYNGCINRIHEYIKRISIGNIVAPEGGIDNDALCDKGLSPGEPLYFYEGFTEPHYMDQPTLPPDVMQERFNLKSDMEYVAGTSQLMVNGATPAGVTSGEAIKNLVEIDSTRLSLTGDYIRNAVRNLAIMWLEVFKLYAETERITKYVGTNDVHKAVTWSNEDINSFDIEFTTENELINSPEQQKQEFMALYGMGAYTDDNGVVPARVKRKLVEYMGKGNYEDIASLDILQIQHAQRENTFFEERVIPEVSEFDNHEIHIDEHMRYILQMDFQMLKQKSPEYAKAMEDHIREHRQSAEQTQQNAMQAMLAQQQRGE